MYPEIQAKLKQPPARGQTVMMTAMRNRWFTLGAAACAAALTASLTAGQQSRDGGDVEILPVHGSVYMIAGAGANIAVSAGKDGVLLVDSGAAPMTDKVLAAIRQLQKELAQREPPPELRFGAETRGTLQASLNYTAAAQADSLHHQHVGRRRPRRRQ